MLDESESKRIVIYTRVSTEEQARGGYSLDAQLDKLKTFVSIKDNWTLVGEYVDDGYTAKNINRPKYKQMFAEINSWDAILVMKMDRIHRNVKNALKMFEDIEKCEKYFISFSENIDTTTAIGRAMMIITLVFAQLESEQTGERVETGMDQKAQDQTVDDFVGCKTPLGYKRIQDPTDKIGRTLHGKTVYRRTFITVPAEIEKIKQMFQMYLDGISVRKIGKKLDIHHSTVNKMLHNPFYAGWPRYKATIKKVSIVKPCISVEDYNKVQDIFIENIDFHKGQKLKAFKIPLNGDKFYKVPKQEEKFLTNGLKPKKQSKF